MLSEIQTTIREKTFNHSQVFEVQRFLFAKLFTGSRTKKKLNNFLLIRKRAKKLKGEKIKSRKYSLKMWKINQNILKKSVRPRTFAEMFWLRSLI